ncbi:cilia- and flagella-associated protein 68 isoform X1 [Erinaceus europaeus]|uniref:Cilia- and flagella-associated protein 68 isoform X1 n=1 Tax=Erinaceus europaeus TaxID=9365 RepID=A0A1S3WXI1_ERIEU|nr:cilia- and flagella-associated protein 68 isoform X1 [Erinaceus europaeus]XP_060036064.1 cilia- and flagella-associated protein 68 isoform X1 [Erinaceus europaeus]XP_060036065.1 cilia- and flagella-associated protein 68 isoform X1 [Erinaceus europaeus]XP_060036066.1 cilia- and flagella-associated protein 68 isoform X1 [Erinaceus europaeus]
MELPNKIFCHSAKTSDKAHISGSVYSSALKRQSLACYLVNPHYGSLINADGHAEVWTDWNNMSKFFQYGWRCNTNENAYSDRTLVGNWNQERYDLKNIVQPNPLPSQFGHYFETTYDASYNSKLPVPTQRFKREPHWFPGHQPELDSPQYKCTGKSTYMSNYSKPQTEPQSLCVCNPNN